MSTRCFDFFRAFAGTFYSYSLLKWIFKVIISLFLQSWIPKIWPCSGCPPDIFQLPLSIAEEF